MPHDFRLTRPPGVRLADRGPRLLRSASSSRVRVTYLETGGVLVLSVLAYAQLAEQEVERTTVELLDDDGPASTLVEFGSARHVH